jgi:hypothetical protein
MVITQEIFEAFMQCRTKSYLSSHDHACAENTLGEARQRCEELYQRNGSLQLRARLPDGQSFVGTPSTETIQQQRYRMILDCAFQSSDLRANVHGLELVRSSRTKGRSAYVIRPGLDEVNRSP